MAPRDIKYQLFAVAMVCLFCYCRDWQDVSESESERYAAFSARFDLAARTKDVAALLKEDPVVTKIHTQLVRCGMVWCGVFGFGVVWCGVVWFRCDPMGWGREG